MANWGGLPSIISALPNDLRNFLQRVKEILDGTGASRFVTVGDLVNGNVAALDAYGNVITNNNQSFDYSPPPTPTNLTAVGAITTIILQWDDPLYANLAHAEIWRASVDNQGVAVLIGTSSGVLYADSVDAQSSYYYWVRFVSRANVTGAFNAINGVHGTTSADPTAMLAILVGQITSGQLHATLGSRINLIDAVNTGLVTQIGTANQSVDDMAAALIQSTLDKADLLDKLARERAISDATVVVDPLTGTVTLLAEAAITTDVEARITTVETNLNAAAGTANTAVARLDVIGAVDEFGVPLTGTLHAMNSAIEANTDGLALKASSTYVEAALAGVNNYIASEADLPLALMRLFLSGGNAIPIMQAAHIRVAHAEQTLTTHTDQLSAEAQARLTLAALVDDNLAALVSEQTARATADSANASDITTLSAQVNSATTGLPAAHAAVQEEASARVSADSAIASAVSQVQARLDTGDYAAVKTESSVSANAITGLSAQYTVKVDVAGHVSGFGLATTAKDAAPSSEFAVRADQFWIAPPSISSDTAPTTNLYTGKVWVDTSVTPNVTKYYNGATWQTMPVEGAIPFVVQASPTTVNGVEVPAGVYIDAAYIKNGTITNAKIGNAAIDDAKIANLSANKITAGSIAVGEYIQSVGYTAGSVGWRVHGDGSAEFNNIYARGNIRATSFSAITLQIGEHIKQGSTAYNTDNGFYLGDNGSGTPVFSLKSATNGLTWDGTTLNINGGGTFSGALSAATGSFSGTLDAATGNFTGSLSGADITGATGDFGGSLLAGTVDITKLIGTTTNYTVAGTYTLTVPADKTSMRVTLFGGGGGGGGATELGGAYTSGGSGGSGFMQIATYSGLTPGATYTLVVGAGGGAGFNGTPGVVVGGAGADGGATYINTLLTAAGGGHGGTYDTWAYNDHAGTGGHPGLAGYHAAPDEPLLLRPGGAAYFNFGKGGNSGGITSYWTGSQPQPGGNGGAIIEFFNPNGVVIRGEWDTLLSALTSQGIATS